MPKNSGITLAHELADAGKDAMTDFEVMTLASEIIGKASYVSQDELIHLMFKYSGTLAAATATRITHILLSENDFNAMISDIEMFDSIEKEVMGE